MQKSASHPMWHFIAKKIGSNMRRCIDVPRRGVDLTRTSRRLSAPLSMATGNPELQVASLRQKHMHVPGLTRTSNEKGQGTKMKKNLSNQHINFVPPPHQSTSWWLFTEAEKQQCRVLRAIHITKNTE